MPEEFQINEGFSQAYMSYRRREEIDKLKARYGDVKLFSKDSHSSHPSDECKHVDSTGPQSCSLSTASSSSSSSSSSSDDDMAEREHEDFLILLDALCRNDPALNDPNRRWFRDSAPTLSPNADFAEPSDKSQKKATKADERKLKKSEMPVLLKDYHREFLLKCDGVEDEGLAKAGEEVALMDSDAMLASLRSDASLAVSRQALIQTPDVYNEDWINRRSAKQNSDPPEQKPSCVSSGLASIDLTKLTFTTGSKPEAEAFLRDYIIGRRWRRPKNSTTSSRDTPLIPSYREVLTSSGICLSGESSTDEKEDDSGTAKSHTGRSQKKKMKKVDVLTPVFCGQVAESKEALTTKKKDEKESSDDDDWLTRKDPPVNDEEILAQDEEFLEKARTFEDRWNKGDPSLSIDFPHSLEQTISEEEEDGESLLKTYPRHPQSSLRQQLKPSRAEKDRLRRERKEAEKTAKLADLARLRQLKMQEYADKLARIRRSCEVDSSSVRQSTSSKQVNLKDISIRKPDVEVGPEGKATKMAHQEVIFSLLEEEDWDPVKQDKLMSLLFENKDDELTGTQDNEEELKDKGSQDDSDEDKPVFSEDSDLDNWRPSGFDNNAGSSSNPSYVHPSSIGGKMRPSLNRSLLNKRALSDGIGASFEDVITGSEPGQNDIYCQFKYRQVTPNDFGLTTEEIFRADEKDLNKWMSIKRICAYRTEEEELQDLRKYRSLHRQKKKTTLMPSLNQYSDLTGIHDQPTGSDLAPGQKLDAEGPSDGPSRSKKKRLRRKRNRQLELSCLYNLDLGTSSNSAKILRGDVESSAKVTMVEEILTDECKEDVRPVVGDVVAKPRLSKYRQKANAPQDYSPSRHKHEQIRDIPKDDDYRGKRAIAVTIKQDKLTDKKSKRDNLLISDARLKAAGIDPKFYRYGKIHKSMKNPEDLAAD